jgi:hypothetical protein
VLRNGPSLNRTFIKRKNFADQKEVRLVLQPTSRLFGRSEMKVVFHPFEAVRSFDRCFIHFPPSNGLFQSVPIADSMTALAANTTETQPDITNLDSLRAVVSKSGLCDWLYALIGFDRVARANSSTNYSSLEEFRAWIRSENDIAIRRMSKIFIQPRAKSYSSLRALGFRTADMDHAITE